MLLNPSRQLSNTLGRRYSNTSLMGVMIGVTTGMIIGVGIGGLSTGIASGTSLSLANFAGFCIRNIRK